MKITFCCSITLYQCSSHVPQAPARCWANSSHIESEFISIKKSAYGLCHFRTVLSRSRRKLALPQRYVSSCRKGICIFRLSALHHVYSQGSGTQSNLILGCSFTALLRRVYLCFSIQSTSLGARAARQRLLLDPQLELQVLQP